MAPLSRVHIPLLVIGQSQYCIDLAQRIVKKGLCKWEDVGFFLELKRNNARFDRDILLNYCVGNDSRYVEKGFKIPSRLIRIDKMQIQGYDLKEKYVMSWNGEIDDPEAKAYTYDKLIVSPGFTYSYENSKIQGYRNYLTQKNKNIANVFDDPIQTLNLTEKIFGALKTQKGKLKILFLNENQYYEQTLQFLEFIFTLAEKIQSQGWQNKVEYEFLTDNLILENQNFTSEVQKILDTFLINFDLSYSGTKSLQFKALIAKDLKEYKYDFAYCSTTSELIPNITDESKYVIKLDELALGFNNLDSQKTTLINQIEANNFLNSEIPNEKRSIVQRQFQIGQKNKLLIRDLDSFRFNV